MKINHFTSILLITLMPFFNGCAQMGSFVSNEASLEKSIDYTKEVKRPANSNELLMNIKYAFMHDFLIRDDFYTSKSLMAFFGGNIAKWNKYKSFEKSVQIEGVTKYTGTVVSQFGCTLYLIDGEDHINPRGTPRGLIQAFFLSDPTLNYELLISVFGIPLNIEDTYPIYMKHPVPVIFNTHELGNKTISYDFSDDKVKRTIKIKIRGDGLIGSFDFTEFLN